MFRRLLKLFILVSLFILNDCNRVRIDLDNKLEEYLIRVKEIGINYVEYEQISLMFNYSLLDELAKDIFVGYDYVLDKHNNFSFTLRVNYHLFSFIEETVYIKKGDLYEKIN